MEYSSSVSLDISSERGGKHPFYLFLIAFRLFGLNLGGDDGTNSLLNIVSKLWTFMMFFCYHFWVLFDASWYFRNKVHENALAESVTVWVAVATFDILIAKRKIAREFMKIVVAEAFVLSERARKKHERNILLTFILVWIFVMIFLAQNIIFNFEKEYNKHHTVSLVGYMSLDLPDAQHVLLLKLDACLECFFVQGFLTMIIALYLLLGLSCEKWFQHLKYHCSNNERSSRLHEIKRFCTKFDHLSSHVQLLDRIFSLPVAVWLLMILVILCIRIVSILNPFLATTNQMILVTILSFGRAAVALIGMNFIADSIYKKAAKTIFQLDNFIREERSALNIIVYQEVLAAFTRFNFNPTHLTFWKIARLNRGFLMTCVGMMATYVIITIQMYPNAKRGLESM
ncbi:hypothetical protein AVEN_65630-1 [Araneus ventricosus]|uniref:Gustatory receptor n=1 Tax=Araneus ventricosus TaxID=182803 RepID=A0A4Y2GYS3_ARAVE|nr:hypothetical protein AVEN_65630-1 [Araneus ventricosus]